MTKFKFKKYYGQNFLQNETIIDSIVDSIKPSQKDLVIEIGPGAGSLTKKLKKYKCFLLAYEIDEELKKYLNPLEDNITKIIFKDFLKTDIHSHLDQYKYEKLFIIGNLPYYITTPILERIIDLKLEPEEIVIMVQKEVADRFLASPKTREYGYMTVLLNYHYKISKIIDVNRVNFKPSPNVDSTVIKLQKKALLKTDYEKLKNLLKNSFQYKRKTIANNLKMYNPTIIKKILEKHGYTLSNRAEDIDLETFVELSNNL